MSKELKELNKKLTTQLPDCDLEEIDKLLKAQEKELIDKFEKATKGICNIKK